MVEEAVNSGGPSGSAGNNPGASLTGFRTQIVSNTNSAAGFGAGGEGPNATGIVGAFQDGMCMRVNFIYTSYF
jgi:hypothetical protein